MIESDQDRGSPVRTHKGYAMNERIGFIGLGLMGTGFTKRAQVFPRIKTEAANFAHRPSSSILVFGTVCLGSILDHDQAMLAGKL